MNEIRRSDVNQSEKTSCSGPKGANDEWFCHCDQIVQVNFSPGCRYQTGRTSCSDLGFDQTGRQTSCWAVRSEALRQQPIDSDGSLKAVWQRRLTLARFFEPASSWERSHRLKLNLNDCIILNNRHINVESTIDQMVEWTPSPAALSCQSRYFTPFYCIK